MTIKKQFEPIIGFLESNSDKTVQEIMGAVLAMCESTRTNITSVFHPETGEVLAIYCYYHKQWEMVHVFEYGVKKSTSTGLNTMCKEGASHWNKQWKKSKLASDQILVDLLNGSIQQEQIFGIQRIIERDKFAIKETEVPGTKSMDEVIVELKARDLYPK